MGLVAMYLGAIVAANLLVAQFGASVTVFNAFVFIGLDLSSRDALHERWHDHLRRNMALLILAGSALSALLNINALPIAIASCVAFAAAATVDTIVYQLLADRPRMVKMNASNLASAAVDSIVFPALAFGFPILWGIVVGQFVAKTLGGLLWAWLLNNVPKGRFV